MELVELIRGAQDAMDRGDYRLSAAACTHILETFPSCLSAHRMLGEAYLEQGHTDPAVEHFEFTLSVDPLNVVARLGLGVAHEEKRRMEDAYSAYLQAWEINPALDQVRDELVRLRGLLNGDERLHPTRAGLAGIYERSGQLGRAAAEWRAVLAADPDNTRARTAIAEILWRSGDDTGAATACQEALDAHPDNARALALMADVEQRRGSNAASELATRYQLVDPTGEIAVLLAEWRDDLHYDVLRRESMPLPDFDFSAQPAYDPPPVSAATPAAPATAPGLVPNQFAAPDLWDTLVHDLHDDGPMPIDNGPVEDHVQPFAWFEEAEPGADPFSMDTLIDSRPAPAAVAEQSFAQDLAPLAATAAFPTNVSFEDQVAALSEPAPAAAPVAVAAATGIALMATAPFGDPETVSAPVGAMAAAPAANPFVTADGRVNLTVGWDDLDRQLKEATPSFDNTGEFDALAAELGVDGIEPFAIGEQSFDDSAWAPFTDDDLGANAPAVPIAPAAFDQQRAPAQTVSFDSSEPIAANEPVLDEFDLAAEGLEPFDPFASGFDPLAPEPDNSPLDAEIATAIPPQLSSGYTDLLRNIDSEDTGDFGAGAELDAFVSPDAAGVPLEFEDLLAVTSKDGTAPLVAAVTDDGDARELEPQQTDGPPARPSTEDAQLDEIESIETEDPAGYESHIAAFGIAAAAGAGIKHQPVAEDDLDVVLEGLGDVRPFSLDESDTESVGVGTGSIDFSDINEAPFDPASLNGIIAVPAMPPLVDDSNLEVWSDADPAMGNEIQPLAAVAPEIWRAGDSAAPELSVTVFPLHNEEALKAPVAQVAQVNPETNGLAVAAGGVAWPAYVNHSSELIDRGPTNGDLFGRLRDSKRQATSAGLLPTSRSLALVTSRSSEPIFDTSVQVVRASAAPVENSAPPTKVRTGGLTESQRIDLMTMRVRLIEDDSSAQEVATALESAIAGGLSDALASRVLGEAYLRLGRNEQAAAQFRNAMLARQRMRS